MVTHKSRLTDQLHLNSILVSNYFHMTSLLLYDFRPISHNRTRNTRYHVRKIINVNYMLMMLLKS